MKNRWSDAEASAFVAEHGPGWGEPLAIRTWSARLLGSEPDLVLHGGGNTSVKTTVTDRFGEAVRVVFVKASGADLATVGKAGHVSLALEPLRRLRGLSDLSDEDMREELLLRRLRPSAATPSVEALVHVFLPPAFVDHTHADAILALTNLREGERLVRDALGEGIIVIPYLRPGFPLARAVAAAFEANPTAEGMVWMHHGLATWGDTARESYERTIRLVSRAEEFLAKRAPLGTAFGVAGTPAARASGAGVEGTPAAGSQSSRRLRTTGEFNATGPAARLTQARERLARFAPVVRGAVSPRTGDPDRPFQPIVLAPLVSEELLGLLAGQGARELATTPPLTTDHLIRTKALPLWLDDPPWGDESAFRAKLDAAVAAYAGRYEAYLAGHAGAMPAGLRAFDPMPRVVLIPGLGALCAGEDARAAAIAADITEHTLRAKAAAAPLGRYEGLPEAELFAMEYRGWQHAKLGVNVGRGAGTAGDTARPATASPEGERSLRGSIAIVTGAAGAIGAGVCRVLLEAGCHVAATDLPGERLDAFGSALGFEFGSRAAAIPLDVTDPVSVAAGFDAISRLWGGADLLVINAGLAHAASLADLAPEEFRRLEAVNVEGTLHLLRRAEALFRAQGTGGDIVLVSTKNVFAPGAGFGAYSATKAAAHQLARVASLELAPLGVRVNMVAPDAVFGEGAHRSGLWAEVGPGRMRARGLDETGLEDYYRQRNLLKARVTARHVGEAVLFFASRRTPTTGATLPVDGGLPDATPR